MAKKIAMIGAGSVVFCKTLMADIMATPALDGQRVRPDEPDGAEAARDGGVRQTMLKDNGVKGSVWATLDRREALKDADFVVVMIQVGGRGGLRDRLAGSR